MRAIGASGTPVKHLAREVKDLNLSLEERNLLSLSYGRIIRKDIESNEGLLPANFERYTVVRPGDVVLRLTDLQNDQRSLRTGLVKEPGIITSAYLTLRPQSTVDSRYFAYALHAVDVAKVFYTLGGGLRQSMGMEEVGGLRLALPQLEEQRRIADFLDDQVARINEARLLRSKQLELLDEMRSASLTRILHSAPGRPMRIAWLLKRSPSYGVLKPEHYDGPDGVPIVRIFNMPKHGEIDVAELMRISPGQDKEYARTRLAPGDVLLSVVGTIGRVAIVGDALNGANLSRAVARLEPRAPWQAPLIATWLQSQGFARFVDETTQGTAQSVLNMGDLARFQILMPESREIALKVADKAVEHLRDGQDVTAGVRQAMEILEEYRSSLITAAVTGEVDVTTARRGIPA